MWVFLNDSFLSIVQHRDQPQCLMVRARIKGDIERAFPGVTATRTPDADYLFRAEMPRSVVSLAMADAVNQIDYGNFKNSVHERDRHEAYLEVWSTMRRFQGARDKAKLKRGK
jgi:hypothetical protein